MKKIFNVDTFFISLLICMVTWILYIFIPDSNHLGFICEIVAIMFGAVALLCLAFEAVLSRETTNEISSTLKEFSGACTQFAAAFEKRVESRERVLKALDDHLK